MATLEQCEQALATLLSDMTADTETKVPTDFNRTVSCHVTDLAVTFSARFANRTLTDLTTEPREKAQIRLTTESDTLVALANREITLPTAWTKGKVKLEASFLDLLKLRQMSPG